MTGTPHRRCSLGGLVLAAALLAGCNSLHIGHVPGRPAAPQPDPDCLACFYLPYAVLAADVYRTRGAATERVQLVLNDNLVRSITKGRDFTQDKLTEMYANARKRQCPDTPASGGAKREPRPNCLGVVADPEVLQAITNAGDEDFIDKVPDESAQCDDRRGTKPMVPITQAAKDFGWERAREIEKYAFTRSWRIFVPDFAIEVWRRERQDDAALGRLEYAVVFRGTAGSGGWFSNLRPITALVPGFWDHYRQALASTRRIVEQIYMIEVLREMTKNPNSKELIQLPLITLVGHSLGAGLARYAYLKVPEATRVIGFNPTPVDGGHTLIPYPERESLMTDRRQDPGLACQASGLAEATPAPSMYFLHEIGEALTELAPCFPGPEWGAEGGPVAHCQSVNLSHGPALRQHAMNIMACRLSLQYYKRRPVERSTAAELRSTP